MKLAVVKVRQGPDVVQARQGPDVVDARQGAERQAAFEAAVRKALRGDVRRKGSGCRTGHFLVRDAAVAAFEQLAAEYAMDVFVYAPETLERPGRS